MKKLLLVLIALGIVGGLWLNQEIQRTLHQPMVLKQSQLVVVEPGQHLKQVVRGLEQQGLIPSAQMLYWYGRIQGLAPKIKAGEFEVEGSFTPIGLLYLLTTNQIKSYQVTFVEGMNFKEFMQRLRAQPKIKHTLADDSAQTVMAALGYEGEHPEGRFFPSTYQYTANMADVDVLRRAMNKMDRELAAAWKERQQNLPYDSAYEVLIMASIIEKETGAPEERAEIAGVFVRRLQKGMRLQTDPTVIYGLGDKYQGNITRAHLRQKTDYNTYVIKGLPPTPIAMPGREAIRAALAPEKGETLFFVAKGDGTHVFSKTLKEHNAAVRAYQLNRRSDYRSSKP